MAAGRRRCHTDTATLILSALAMEFLFASGQMSEKIIKETINSVNTHGA